MKLKGIAEIIPGICVAVILCSRSLTELIDIPFASIILLIIAIAFSLICSKEVLLNKNISIFIISILLFFFFGIIIAKSNVPKEYLFYFCCFGILPSLTQLKLNLLITYKSILFIGLILLYPYYTDDYSPNLEGAAQKYMDMSYKVLIFILTGLLCLLQQIPRIYKLLALIVLLGYLILFLAFGSRGAIVSVLAFLMIYWIISARSKHQMYKRLLFISITITLCAISFELIIVKLYNVLAENDVDVLAISRIYQLLEDGKEMSTGRDNLAGIAINGILSSPVFGHGIGSFDNYSGLYPHNIILQLLWEGGVLLTIPIISLVIIGFKNIFNNNIIKEYRIFLLLLFSSGIIQLFFSSFLWMSLCLWLFIWIVIRIKNYKIMC